MKDHPWAAVWLTLFCFMLLLSCYSLVTLCYSAHKTKSIWYYSLLIAAMSIMTLTYAIEVVSQAFWISYNNDLNNIESKYLAYADAYYIEYLNPVPTLLYCLH
jgi:hypothetical protein